MCQQVARQILLEVAGGEVLFEFMVPNGGLHGICTPWKIDMEPTNHPI